MDDAAFLAKLSTESDITDADAIAAVTEVLGAPPRDVEQFAGGFGGIPFRATSDDGRALIVRIASDPDRPYAQEARIMGWVAERGIPVPRVLGVTRIREHPASVLECLPGIAVSEILRTHERNDPAIAGTMRAVGAVLRRIHQLDHSSLEFDPAVLPRRNQLRDLDPAYPLLTPDQRRLTDAAAARYWPIAAPPRTALLHKDFGPEHVFVDDFGVTGLIDWEHAGPGDPARDLAWWRAYDEPGSRIYELVRSGYGSVADATFDERVDAWAGVELLNGLVFAGRNGLVDNVAPTCSRLERLLAARDLGPEPPMR